MFFGSFVSHASSFLRPVAPRPLRRFIATMSALTPAKVPPGQVSTLHALRLRTARPPPTCSAPSLARRHAAGGLPRPSLSKAGRSFAPRRDARPKRPGVGQPGRLRLRHGLRRRGSGFPPGGRVDQRNRPYRVCYPVARSFTSCCSPPRLAATQLLSVSPSWREGRGDLHPADDVRSGAHPPAQRARQCLLGGSSPFRSLHTF